MQSETDEQKIALSSSPKRSSDGSCDEDEELLSEVCELSVWRETTTS